MFKLLTHESCETFVGPRDSGLRVDFNQDILFSVDVDLEEPCPIQRRIKQHEQALMCDVWSTCCCFSVVFLQKSDVVVTIKQFKIIANLVKKERKRRRHPEARGGYTVLQCPYLSRF